jgi:hypothetical protein
MKPSPKSPKEKPEKDGASRNEKVELDSKNGGEISYMQRREERNK